MPSRPRCSPIFNRYCPGQPISRLIFLNRFFFPDHSATSQILSDLAFFLAARGHDVHVVASRQIYDDPAAELPKHQNVEGVQIHRVATSRFGRATLVGRMLDYLTFYCSAALAVLKLAGKNDVVIAKTDPPLLSVLIWALSRARGFRRVNWLQDLYPEIAAELGVTRDSSAFNRSLASLRDYSLRAPAVNVAVGRDMAHRLKARAIVEENLHVIENWTDDDRIAPIEPSANPLRKDWSLDGKFVVAYSGNLGHAHDIETMLSAAHRLRVHSDIVFLFIGGGRGFADVAARSQTLGLSNLVFEPYQPREQLAQSLSAGDIHWLSLKRGFDGLVLPSKFYGIAAAARPMIVIGSRDGELAKLVSEHDCGHCIEPGEADLLAQTILSLAADPARCAQMGASARSMLEARFAKAQALKRWESLLESVIGPNR